MPTTLDNFYKELSSTFSAQNQEDFSCTIRLHAEHPIYKGHFEAVPITPGVCLMQIIKELLMAKFEEDLMMTNGDNIKFLAMVNPRETSELNISFAVKKREDGMDVSAAYTNASGTCYMKFKGSFETRK